MRILLILFISVSFQWALDCPPSSLSNGDISGYWLSPIDDVSGRTSIIKIVKQDGKYFGYKVVYLDSLPSENDTKNERYSLRDRSALGSVFIYNLEKNAQDSYINGRYYDFNSGKIFHLRLKLECSNLVFIISVDNMGMLSDRKIYKYLDPNDVKFYISNEPKADFRGVEAQ